ncbi:hypothetical protein PR202_ga11346 [Eleusine coracana subsp. coracana]|uniref:4Fe-4S ferredoxin-type domain-containing protein n=1 Tax=Eleusine coracana subsp. coracana TaxID=191504 RepID=A0AAV5C8R4_ELECO|nr:hypothetical protein PR202_ga11346 [Eleusine coracana subsp. coracana]
MAAVPVPPLPLLASHAAVRAAASRVVSSSAKRGRLAGDHPAQVAALRRGDWVKLICGASFEDAADVRNLSLVYTLAGADASVVGAVNEGIDVAASIIPAVERPWVMISVNDDSRDLHFRKAEFVHVLEFDPEDCPPNCSKPCEKVCPADAISLESAMVGGELSQYDPSHVKSEGGVITERCYGCGRCLPVCPYDRIRAVSYIRDPTTTTELLRRNDVDAIEIHTTGKGTGMFNTLWNNLSESINSVKLVAVSLPDIGVSTVDFMNSIYEIMEPHLQGYNLWQLDGRPMSGDIGRGATRETISFAVHMASMSDGPPGFYQLAGGTNSHTIDSLKKAGLFQSMTFPGNLFLTFLFLFRHLGTAASEMTGSQQALIGGIAYGGYARKIIGRTLRKIPTQFGCVRIEDHPDYLLEALQEALSLVGPVKGYPTL